MIRYALSFVIFFSFTSAFVNTVAEEQNSTQYTHPDLTRDPFQRARDVIPNTKQKIAKPQIEGSQTLDAELTNIPINNTDNEFANIQGFSYEFAATVDAFIITAGGILEPSSEAHEQDSSGVFGVVDLVAEFDTEKSNLWDDGLFFFYSALAFGTAPAVGDLNGISDKYAGDNTLRIIEAWYEHKFPYSHSSFLIGLQDFSNEFYRTEFSKPLLNRGFRLGQTIRVHGNISTYPITTLGLRFKSQLNQSKYFQIALFDGEIDSSAMNKVIDIDVEGHKAVLLVSELGMNTARTGAQNEYRKLAVGAWYLKGEQLGFLENIGESNEDYLLANNPSSGNAGAYLIAESAWGENIGLFFKHERTKKTFNRYGEYYSAGLHLRGIIPERNKDVLAFGVVHTRHTDTFMEENPGKFFSSETIWEVTYHTKLSDWINIQPDFQYIQRPSMTSPLDQANTAVLGVRIEATF